MQSILPQGMIPIARRTSKWKLFHIPPEAFLRYGSNYLSSNTVNLCSTQCKWMVSSSILETLIEIIFILWYYFMIFCLWAGYVNSLIYFKLSLSLMICGTYKSKLLIIGILVFVQHHSVWSERPFKSVELVNIDHQAQPVELGNPMLCNPMLCLVHLL